MVARFYFAAVDNGVIGGGDGIGDDGALDQGYFLGEAERIFTRSQHVLCVASVNVVSEHHHPFADVLSPFTAHSALPAAVNGGQQYTISFFPLLYSGAQACNRAGNLVS